MSERCRRFALAAMLASGVLAGSSAMAQALTGAPAGTASRAEDASDAAMYGMRIEKFSLKEIKAADAALFVQQLETERAKSRAAAEAASANSQRSQLSSQSLANDLEVRKDLFVAQARYNIAIFIMVFAVVAAGLWFSFLQFTADRHAGTEFLAVVKEMAKLAPENPASVALGSRLEAMGNKTRHSFEAGPIKVDSNVIGLIVLAISLAFFYLYLVHVYTIRTGHDVATLDTAQTLGDTKRKAEKEGLTALPGK